MEKEYNINMTFNPKVAQKIGTDAAIMLANIKFWVDKNRANGKNFHDGRYWTYNSVSAFEKLFWYLSKSQIRTCLKKLEEGGYIETGNYNKSPYDKTKWYCVIENTDLSNFTNPSEKTTQPIPYNKPYSKPDDKLKTKQKKGERDLEGFNEFWDLYDKKVGFKKAQMAWCKIKESEKQKIMDFIPKYKQSQPDKKFRQNPSTFLNSGTWNDELIDRTLKKELKQKTASLDWRDLISETREKA